MQFEVVRMKKLLGRRISRNGIRHSSGENDSEVKRPVQIQELQGSGGMPFSNTFSGVPAFGTGKNSNFQD